MKQTIAIRHVAFEDLGLIDPILRSRGYDIVYQDAWNLDRERVEGADLVVFLGGPISVNDTEEYPFLAQELALAKSRIGANRPTLGICLGAQIIARAIGGTVRPGPEKEIGWRPVSLTVGGRASILAPLEGVAVLHWHGEVCELPPGTESLAHTPACANQAFIPGPACLALQFHIEAGADGIEPWLVGHTGEISAASGVTVAGLRADTARLGPALRQSAEAVMHRWLSEVSPAS
ncbi:MAG: glutamine amidotransferase [Bradyrhizobium sp.]|uniref:glutamine amidotransferase n=1 Tax=Bradyrhizobium sp. TaxID=376 RepID=UPI003D0A6DDD